MKDPARLIDHSTDPELVRLLRAGRDETPSAQALRRTLRAVAVGGGVAAASLSAAAHNAAAGSAAGVGSTSVGAAATTASSSLAAASGAGVAAASATLAGAGVTATAGAGAAAGTFGAKVLGATGIAKWMGLGALTAATATFVPDAAQWVRQASHFAPSRDSDFAPSGEVELPHTNGVAAASSAAPGTAFKSEAQAAILPLGATLASPVDGVAPADVVRPVAVSAGVMPQGTIEHARASAATPLMRTHATPTSVASDFSEQVEIVEQARQAIAQGDAARGLNLLLTYEQRYARGQLLPEVLVLRLDALTKLGRTAEARAVAQRILRRGATGVHAKRARSMLGE